MSHSIDNHPLSNEQKKQKYPSGVMPSGEGNFFDFSQSHEYHRGSGINYIFPHPNGNNEFSEESGVIKTYPPSGYSFSQKESGIFSYNDLRSLFSNAHQVSGNNITSFNLDNSYIHYYPIPGEEKDFYDNHQFEVPFLSSYKETIQLFDPYAKRILNV
jgi:hypothetical protein